MQYSLESAKLWDHTLLDTENPKPMLIVFKGKNLKDDNKLEHPKKHADKIIA